MIRQIRQIHHLHAHFLRLSMEARSVFGRRIVVVDGVGVRHRQSTIQHRTHGFERAVDTILDGSDDM